ncbi:MAG: LacI family DNA-binding transcriptional regulator [Opitutaceae bacterium]
MAIPTLSISPLAGQMKVSQQHIADELNLSRTTVSRCFTNHPKINPETRSAVFQLATKLGYNYSAPRNVEAKKPAERNTIAVLVGLAEENRQAADTAAAVINGISERAAAQHLELQLHYVDPAQFRLAPRARKILPEADTSDWRGTILIYPFHEESVINLMAKFPTVAVLDDYDLAEIDCINPDEGRGISRMVQHLYDLGHRRIGFLSWKYPVSTPWVGRRVGAYLENLYRLGLEIEPDHILNVRGENSMPLDELSNRVARLVRQGVTGWVCAADHQAYPLLVDLKNRGIRVPHDCSITGFDGIRPPRGLPQLTTMRTPFREMGISSVVSLLRKIDQPSAARRHIMVSSHVVIGKTTARPPA